MNRKTEIESILDSNILLEPLVVHSKDVERFSIHGLEHLVFLLVALVVVDDQIFDYERVDHFLEYAQIFLELFRLGSRVRIAAQTLLHEIVERLGLALNLNLARVLDECVRAVEELVERETVRVDVEFFRVLTRVELGRHVVATPDFGHHYVVLVEFGNTHVGDFGGVVGAD